MDNRGRIYYNSAGSAFGLQTGDFSKALIDLLGNHYESKINNNTPYLDTNKAYISYVASLTKHKEPFQYLRVNLGILPTTISNDASCSGTSILSAIVGFKKGLFLTNVFASTDSKNKSEQKQCIYSYFLNTMREKYPVSINSLYTPDIITKKSAKLKISEDRFIILINYALNLFKEPLLEREHAKVFVMRKNYSETNKGRLEYIYQTLQIAFALANEEIGPIESKVYRSLCYYLAQWVDKLYHEVFLEIAEFCGVLISHFENKNPITLSCPNNSDFQYQQLLYQTVKVARPSFQKVRKSDLSIHIQTDEPDYKKISRSLIANFIHYLDSRLNFSVINKCRMSGVVLWTNHDCFYVHPENKNIVLKHYYDSYVELLLESDVVEHFLKINGIKPDAQFEKLLQTYKNNRKNILKAIKNHKVCMSEFILTS